MADDLPVHAGAAKPSTPSPQESGCWRHAGHDTIEAAVRYDNRYPDAFTTAWTAAVGSARIAPAARGAPDPADPHLPAPRAAAQPRQAERVPRLPAAVPARHHCPVRRLGPHADACAGADAPAGGLVHRGRPRRRVLARHRVGGDADGDYRKQCEFAPWSSMVNVCGLPAISIPVHWTGRHPGKRPADGNPTGRADGFRSAAAAGGRPVRLLAPVSVAPDAGM